MFLIQQGHGHFVPNNWATPVMDYFILTKNRNGALIMHTDLTAATDLTDLTALILARAKTPNIKKNQIRSLIHLTHSLSNNLGLDLSDLLSDLQNIYNNRRFASHVQIEAIFKIDFVKFKRSIKLCDADTCTKVVAKIRAADLHKADKARLVQLVKVWRGNDLSL